MQDRFKFRLWDKKQGKLAYPNNNAYHNMEMVNYLLFVNNSNLEWDLDKYELMQCTGLKDKNGNLIYEGDIVKFKTIQNLWAKGKVVFTESCALFEVRYGIDFNNWELMDKYQYEVIGNIYTDAHLLEGAEND